MNTEHLFVRLLRRLKILPYFNLTSRIKEKDQEFKIPLSGELGLQNLFISERWMTKLLEKLQPFFAGAFIDVGVNVGQTMLKTYAINKEVNYIGFEPNPVCIHYLQQLIKVNKINNAKLIPVAVADTTGVIKLNFFHSEATDSTA